MTVNRCFWWQTDRSFFYSKDAERSISIGRYWLVIAPARRFPFFWLAWGTK